MRAAVRKGRGYSLDLSRKLSMYKSERNNTSLLSNFLTTRPSSSAVNPRNPSRDDAAAPLLLPYRDGDGEREGEGDSSSSASSCVHSADRPLSKGVLEDRPPGRLIWSWSLISSVSPGPISSSNAGVEEEEEEEAAAAAAAAEAGPSPSVPEPVTATVQIPELGAFSPSGENSVSLSCMKSTVVWAKDGEASGISGSGGSKGGSRGGMWTVTLFYLFISVAFFFFLYFLRSNSAKRRWARGVRVGEETWREEEEEEEEGQAEVHGALAGRNHRRQGIKSLGTVMLWVEYTREKGIWFDNQLFDGMWESGGRSRGNWYRTKGQNGGTRCGHPPRTLAHVIQHKSPG
jgi:hypothetical protein